MVHLYEGNNFLPQDGDSRHSRTSHPKCLRTVSYIYTKVHWYLNNKNTPQEASAPALEIYEALYFEFILLFLGTTPLLLMKVALCVYSFGQDLGEALQFLPLHTHLNSIEPAIQFTI